MIKRYFTILNALEDIQAELSMTDNYQKTKEIMKFKNYFFSEIVNAGVETTIVKDMEFDDDEYDYIVITDENGKKHKCRKKFISNIPVQDVIPVTKSASIVNVAQKTETVVIPEPVNSPTVVTEPILEPLVNTPIVEPEIVSEPVEQKVETEPTVTIETIPEPVENTEPVTPTITEENSNIQIPTVSKELTETIGFFQTDKVLNAPEIKAPIVEETPITDPTPAANTTSTPIQEPEPAIEIEKSEYYKEVMSGKAVSKVLFNDLTVDFKDITIHNPLTHTSNIVNITAVPMSVADSSDKSEGLFFLEGLGSEPILSYSTRENPTAKIDHNGESIGITGNWVNGVFGTNVMSLSNSKIDFSPDDELIWNNDSHEIGHCVVEIPTASGKKIEIHGFPLTTDNNDKGTADAMICIINDGVYEVKHLNFQNPIYKMYNREFEAKVMTFWDGRKSFNMSVEVTPK